jgi:cytochrome b
MSIKVRVWDLPTRLFHWAFALCFIGLVITGQIAGAALYWHFLLGYSTLSLLLFRLVWGVVGGRWSRFRNFVKGPTAIAQYLRGMHQSAMSAGHNPLGALSVLALLFFPVLQVLTGLMSDDEIATSGPLAKMVPSQWVSAATFYHAQIGKPILIGLVLLHLLAIIFYRVRQGKNLIGPMVHGDQLFSRPMPSSRDDGVSRTMAAIIFLLCVVLVSGLVQWAS